jgi:hypothetical protein
MEMRCWFPQFGYRRVCQKPTWIGTLTPTETSVSYGVKIVYQLPKAPQVWIVSPPIVSHAPHRYRDHSLCLYYPKDRSWTPTESLATTIVPWTAEWLALYEIWCVAGIWYGAEAPHTRKTKLRKR